MVSTAFKWNARIAGVGVERGDGRAVRGTRRYDQKAGEAPKRILRMNLSRVHIPTLYGQVSINGLLTTNICIAILHRVALIHTQSVGHLTLRGREGVHHETTCYFIPYHYTAFTTHYSEFCGPCIQNWTPTHCSHAQRLRAHPRWGPHIRVCGIKERRTR